jgi:hypothetical protein
MTRMPRGPRGEKRPADVIGNAVGIATGEAEEDLGKVPKRATGGRKGGKARPRNLSQREKKDSTTLAAFEVDLSFVSTATALLAITASSRKNPNSATLSGSEI